MSGSAQDLAASARQLGYTWLTASLTWSDHTASDFHDRCWLELEQEADDIAREGAALEEVLSSARRAIEL